MANRELQTHGLGPTTVTAAQQHAAAVHVADRIAAAHPKRTAAALAADPLIAVGLLELLDAIGYLDHHRRTP